MAQHGGGNTATDVSNYRGPNRAACPYIRSWRTEALRITVSTGAMRVSFGIASNFADAYRFLQFANGFRDKTALEISQL